MIEEIWKDIKGYEGLYQVSNLGRVKRRRCIIPNTGTKGNSGTQTIHERIMKLQTNKYGYLYVCLSQNGQQKHHTVHRLVANAFLSNPDNKPQVNHINGIKTDNTINNLEWSTGAENMIHAFKIGLKSKPSNFGNKSKRVLQYTLDGNLLAEYPSAMEASRKTGFSQGNISSVCRGECTQRHGYIWKYKQ